MSKNEQKPLSAESVAPLELDVRIHSIHNAGARLVDASINLGGAFAIRGVRLMNGKNGPFLNFPSYRTGNGDYKDICSPTSAQLRQRITDAVVDAYNQALNQKIASRDEPEIEEPESGCMALQ
ncbi:SpoVG family protein [Anaerotruncus rubiinfantis]|uniref:SpoVG family protein n=1 Tax=Anaerotruncus rubiinfantis TaxID=1720200 RepID=UPI00082D8899|nr:SpoVG family protein [Anaerotruncus rubiinfantis]